MKVRNLAMASLLAASVAGAAQAQIVVQTDQRTGGCVYVYDRPNALATAQGQARARWGDNGDTLLASNRAGFGAAFGVRDSRSGEVKFWARTGYSSLEQVIQDTRADAIAYVRDRGLQDTVFICGNWNNTGAYPLDAYPTYGES